MSSHFYFNVNNYWREHEFELAQVVARAIIGHADGVCRKDAQGDGDWHLNVNSNAFWLHRKETSKLNGENITRYEVNARLNYNFSAVKSAIISHLEVGKYNP